MDSVATSLQEESQFQLQLTNMDGISIICNLLQNITVLFTFGFTYPILAIIIVIAIYNDSILYQIQIGYQIELSLLVNNNNNRNSILYSTDILSNLDSKFLNSYRVIPLCSRWIIIVITLFWSLLFFDMIADEFGIIAGVIMITVFFGGIFILIFVIELLINKIDRLKSCDEWLFHRLFSHALGFLNNSTLNAMTIKSRNSNFSINNEIIGVTKDDLL